jgi:endonuclease/exonuclease/phosphatase family protein/VCBS repeat protein
MRKKSIQVIVLSLLAASASPASAQNQFWHNVTKLGAPRHELYQNFRSETPGWKILEYNVHMLEDGWFVPDCHDNQRDSKITQKILGKDYDVVVFAELQEFDRAREMLGNLAAEFPYVTGRQNDTCSFGASYDGGVRILSRYPIENGDAANAAECGNPARVGEFRFFEQRADDVQNQHVAPRSVIAPLVNNSPTAASYCYYHDCANHSAGGYFGDCSADKGVVYARIRKNNYEKLHLFATHAQASYPPIGPKGSGNQWSACQLAMIDRFIADKVAAGVIQPTDYVFILGDFNVNVRDLGSGINSIAALHYPHWSWLVAPLAANTIFDADARPKVEFGQDHFHERWKCELEDSPNQRISYSVRDTAGRKPRNWKDTIIWLSDFYGGGSFRWALSDHHPVEVHIDRDEQAAKAPLRLTQAANASQLLLTATALPEMVSYDYERVLTGDFDGDGKTDILKWDVPAGSATERLDAWVLLARGGGWKKWSRQTSTNNRHTILLAADVSGDGRTDLIFNQVDPACNVKLGCPSNLAVALANPGCATTGTSLFNCDFGNYSNFLGPSSWGTNAHTQMMVGDFNGDQKADVLKIGVDRGAPTRTYDLWVGISTTTNAGGPSFKFAHSATPTTPSAWATDWRNASYHEYLTGDFTGDGKTDVLRIDRPPTDAGACDVGFWVGRSTSDGGTTGSFDYGGQPWATACSNIPENSRYLVGDVDGNYHDDVIAIDTSSDTPTPKTITLFRSTGSSFVVDVLEHMFAPYPAVHFTTSRHDKFLLGNISGGNLDIIRIPVDGSGPVRPGTFGAGCISVFEPFKSAAAPDWRLRTVDTCHAVMPGGPDIEVYREIKVLSGNFDGDANRKTDFVLFPIP